MMTEDEATEKWCPHARLLEPYAEKTSINRGTDDAPVSLCIGSACMAWRWAGVEVEQKLQPKDQRRFDGGGIEADGWRYVVSYDDGMDLFERAKSDGKKLGYCGLAGTPS